MVKVDLVRPVDAGDYAGWKPLWDGYNAFYGRKGETALPDEITQATYLFHRSTTHLQPVCYLQDLFTLPSERGRGVGRALIEAVIQQASEAGAKRIYWHTQETNVAGRRLYDQVAKHQGFIVYSLNL